MITKKIWGPYIWYIMHIVSFNYPNSIHKKNLEKTKNLYLNFYNHIFSIIPCIYCREHYKLQMEKFPIKKYMEEDKLGELIVFYHNNVNSGIFSYQKDFVKKKIYSFNQAKKLYVNKNGTLKIKKENIFNMVQTLILCNIDYKMIIKILHDIKNILYNYDFFKNIPKNIIDAKTKKEFIHNFFIWKNKFD
jgi:hypothetical protein